MSTSTQNTVRLARTIQAPLARVFEAWTSPADMQNWCCPDPTASLEIEQDLRVGGKYRIRMNLSEGKTATAYGVYKEVDAPRKLRYTWEWEEEDHHLGVETVITVEFLEKGAGTEVRVTHEGFPSVEARDDHDQGWAACVDRLVQRLD
jgi:glutathione S-transferase